MTDSLPDLLAGVVRDHRLTWEDHEYAYLCSCGEVGCEHFTAAVMAVVQPELDRLTAQVERAEAAQRALEAARDEARARAVAAEARAEDAERRIQAALDLCAAEEQRVAAVAGTYRTLPADAWAVTLETTAVRAALTGPARTTPTTHADHPYTDPGDGRVQCPVCGKYVWMVTHSCKGVRVAPPTTPTTEASSEW